MARKVGFGGGRRSVLRRGDIAERAEAQGLSPPSGEGTGRAAIFLGFALLYGIPLLFAAIGAYPLFTALSFPDRAHEVEAEVTGLSSVQMPGEAERLTSITVKYETRRGARLTADVATDRPFQIGETVVIFYDPDAPRYARLKREMSLDEAMDRTGDRIYFAYFAIGFDILVTIMLVLVIVQGRKRP